ncbi:MAG TPA: 23S rRNA (pseudouridine(1915)-N(3))-methyltransferase RlmH [Syntrophomonadaceae bacterium]|nr:23S rRNA (pseudouridine(1915)-N(3))-methyltransferase RlmH [Syntrophomonadaceae bacterium]
MSYRIISAGRVREPFYHEGVKEYLKRLGSYTQIQLVDGLEEKISPRAGSSDIQKALQKEAERILSLIGKDEILVLLDSHGTELTSEELAARMEGWTLSAKRINFVIGSANGVADLIRGRADFKLSLSRLTLPHQMAVLVVAEQIYRGFKILKGEPYHK